MYTHFIDLFSQFSPSVDHSLAPFTTWKIGGPADILIESNSSEDLLKVVQIAQSNQIPYTILGGGSDVLISDQGVRGVVIINKSKNIQILDDTNHAEANLDITDEESGQFNPWIQPRHGEEKDTEFYTFDDLDYVETEPRKMVKMDSGVNLPYAIAWMLKNELTGLQFFAGIPGTVGGALYNNIHGGTKHFSDYFVSAEVLTGNGEYKILTFQDFEFGYDQSLLRKDRQIVVLSVTFGLHQGDVQKAKFVATEWTKRKRAQPRQTAGCTFKNISLEKQSLLGFPTPSVGYIVDKLLGWGGKTVGNAAISPYHKNFIENLGGATAQDVLTLIHLIEDEAKQRYNLDLETEINLLGF